MSRREIVVIGGSAGAISLRVILAGLDADFPAAIFVVVHSSPDGPGLLPRVLSRSGPLPARHASDVEIVREGRSYVTRDVPIGRRRLSACRR
jgi:two-component system, chemotaxis family, protein-glutamate methylesterase/glutaminase